MKEFSEKVDFEKKSADDKKHVGNGTLQLPFPFPIMIFSYTVVLATRTQLYCIENKHVDYRFHCKTIYSFVNYAQRLRHVQLLSQISCNQ